jgi:hypothetical protein
MRHIIHVNQHVIKRNQKTGEREPVLTVKNYKANRYAHSGVINGPCVVRYEPDCPLSCGARVWIETEAGVELGTLPTLPAAACETAAKAAL